MGKLLKKYERGAAVNYVSRKAALKKLQLTLKDFRRLCILKGIHPHEPKHKKKVNKGSTRVKTWYYAKDIQFLQHEPVIQKFREYKIFLRRLTRAKSKRERHQVKKLYKNKPKYSLDHIVKERYPTFLDAIRDLDDALCLLFLFSRLPRSLVVTTDTVTLCRKLTVEFMHYVIEARALRKAFVSIKGIYYQAEVFGQTVNWIAPHERGLPKVSEVDFRVMATFVEFYTTALKFVNYKLFNQLGLRYPPLLGKNTSREDFDMYNGDVDAMPERLYSLSESLKKDMASTSAISNEIAEPVLDNFPEQTDLNQEEIGDANKSRQHLKQLFEKCKVFLSRETPKESLTFVLRSCGAKVSWDKTVAYGATFTEDDESITHQISDRPKIDNPRLSRCYVQPQWVYDCLNANIMLPVDNYLPGATLPPHLSPFVQVFTDEYIPPEKIALLEQQGQDTSNLITFVRRELENEDDEESVSEQHEERLDERDSGVESDKEVAKPSGTKSTKVNKLSGKRMSVKQGKATSKNSFEQKAQVEKVENKKMREMMIPKKQRRVYEKIIKKRKHIKKEAENLKVKRQKIESAKRKMKKTRN